jgi:hypothetical protein
LRWQCALTHHLPRPVDGRGSGGARCRAATREAAGLAAAVMSTGFVPYSVYSAPPTARRVLLSSTSLFHQDIRARRIERSVGVPGSRRSERQSGS